MGMKRACDVYGGTKDVKRYCIMVTEIDDDGSAVDHGQAMDSILVDLSTEGFKRLEKFIVRGTSAVGRKGKE